ncbi:oxidoreductase [Streptomyces sp. NRRL S-920]|uniref:oxidoreductase n=1 Tax=Streptomyces sp. NRRL S-920 TaxID=1463921 RepID=UPI00068B4139|nr:oxidoreductase [Streptomyces sp. NRRL S-920]
MIQSQSSPAGHQRTGGHALPPAAVASAARSAAVHTDGAERERRLHEETAGLLTRAGFARHFVPRAWGGTEGTYAALLDAAATVGAGCASAAWCGALWGAHGRFAAYLPPDGQRDLWAASPDVRISAVMSASGEARPTRDGWLLSGAWPYASGVAFADWLLLASTEPVEQGGRCRVFAVPRARATILDTWRADGMRGTGSHTVVVESVPVPRHRSFLMADLTAGAPGPGRASCHTVPAELGGGLLFCAPALGAARHALEAWSRGAARRARDLSDADALRLHRVLAVSADEIEAAQLLLRDAAQRADADAWTERDVARNRRIAASAIGLLARAVERLHRTGVRPNPAGPDVVGRCRRDVRTVAGHRMLRRERAAVDYARSVFSELSDVPALPVTAPAVPAPSVPAPARDLTLEAPHADI